MRMPQLTGIAVTAAITLGVELPPDWLFALAVFGGALTTYFVTLATR